MSLAKKISVLNTIINIITIVEANYNVDQFRNSLN